MDRNGCVEQIFDAVVGLSRARLHGRLQSRKWKPPAYKRAKAKNSLGPSIQRMMQNPSRLTQNTQPIDAKIVRVSKSLIKEIDHLDAISESDDELETLKCISRTCHSLVSAARHITSSSAFHQATKFKEFENIRKIARYWDMCNHMTRICQRHNDLFSAVVYCPMPPFQSQLVGDSLKCFVHAEVQIVTFYTCKPCNPMYHLPRVIGTSKAACYLCEFMVNFLLLAHTGSSFRNGTFQICRTMVTTCI